ncbi:MAG: zinc-ribbon domain-containing protein [Desulfobacteraceae bacterium]|nr:zinc-ribbon domain-containing protein [Desulfobacteraceae bacterium]
MRVQCPGCGAGFALPDEKMPEGRSFRILCPKCKGPIEIGAREPVQEKVGTEAFMSPAVGGFEEDGLDFANAIDAVEEGVKTALLCVANIKKADKMAQALQELDFWVVHASRSGLALGKLHHNNYDLIVLEDDFDSAKASANLVLHHVQLLPMHVRRQFYLCLLSETMPTLDAMLAFRLGVNMILNVQNLDKAKVILARAMKEFRTFYSFFNAELAKKHG